MELAQYIIVNNSLGMNKGKIAAQCAHASILAVDKADEELVNEWKMSGMKKIVLKIGSTEELIALFEKTKKQLPCALVTDAGRTQIEAGSKTCFGCGPVRESDANKFFGELKLL